MVERREIILRGKTYKTPEKIGAQTQLEYLDALDKLDGATKYRREQYQLMAEQIAAMFGHQFTAEDVLDEEGGLSLSAVMVQFSTLEAYIYDDVDAQVAEVQENFTPPA